MNQKINFEFWKAMHKDWTKHESEEEICRDREVISKITEENAMFVITKPLKSKNFLKDNDTYR